jgi:hypothetical protein
MDSDSSRAPIPVHPGLGTILGAVVHSHNSVRLYLLVTSWLLQLPIAPMRARPATHSRTSARSLIVRHPRGNPKPRVAITLR